MHNSLYIRDLLRRTNSDPMRVERRDPHRSVAPDPAARPGKGDFVLDGVWQIRHDGQNGAVEATQDLADFCSRMGIACARRENTFCTSPTHQVCRHGRVNCPLPQARSGSRLLKRRDYGLVWRGQSGRCAHAAVRSCRRVRSPARPYRRYRSARGRGVETILCPISRQST